MAVTSEVRPGSAPAGSILPAKSAAIGTSAAIVPTLVPMDMEMKHAAMNRPAYMRLPGSSLSVRFTVASMAPICLAVAANAPAMMNIHIIISMFLLAAPCENVFILSSRDFPLLMTIAYIEAIMNAEKTEYVCENLADSMIPRDSFHKLNDIGAIPALFF